MENVPEILGSYKIRPSKMLGQNFLTSKQAVKKIVGSADLTKTDTVLEVGPGTGSLTWELCQKAGKVIVIEKDQKMIEVLRERLRSWNVENVTIIKEDILKFQIKEPCKVVGNLPFYLTSPLIRKFLESNPRPSLMVLVVQKEVAQRICAKPPRMSLLAVSVQIYSSPRIISYLSKKLFWPRPEVDAAVIEIVPKPSRIGEKDLFFRIAKAGFSQPRKQLANNLSKGLGLEKDKISAWLKKNGIDPSWRAEVLSLEQWIKLTKSAHSVLQL